MCYYNESRIYKAYTIHNVWCGSIRETKFKMLFLRSIIDLKINQWKLRQAKYIRENVVVLLAQISRTQFTMTGKSNQWIYAPSMWKVLSDDQK